MLEAKLEHVNLTVTDPLKSAKMFSDIFGWHIRWQGEAKDGGMTVHVGEENTYLALYTQDKELEGVKDSYSQKNGLNHLGFVVADLDIVEQRVRAAGFQPHHFDDYDPGKRFYFNDHSGLELEVVCYK